MSYHLPGNQSLLRIPTLHHPCWLTGGLMASVRLFQLRALSGNIGPNIAKMCLRADLYVNRALTFSFVLNGVYFKIIFAITIMFKL